MNFRNDLATKIALIDNELLKYLQQIQQDCPPQLYESLEYSLFPGGKRLRPVILLAVCEALGGRTEDALPFACALEIIHNYSLTHDDLPCMDDDDMRRGKPSNHKVFGEAMAILAGDGLLNLAYEIMAEFCSNNPNPNFLRAMAKIAKNAGVTGMVGGQALDIQQSADLRLIHENKTAKLFISAFAAGALCANNTGSIDFFENLGLNFGLAFQIMDDIDDGQSSSESELAVPLDDAAKMLQTLENSEFLQALLEYIFKGRE
ncbi:MAG: polyprenyl synthetase family protein [Clostridiales bacterium]|jgi:geranylgeranyl diphosphate synthase type II|nr:polyprenyl synthetase family protein [Clostridiales bacterium]